MKPYIEILNDQQWQNWHRTLHTGGEVTKLLKPYNQFEQQAVSPDRPFIAGMAGLQAIIAKAKQAQTKVRAYGSKWSLNNIAFTQDYIVDSNQLDYSLIGIEDNNYVQKDYQGIKDQLAFVQCGVMVKTLNQRLQEKNLALPTSGASDGQTFIGAVSTGTHGSAHAIGAMENYVRGIHLVTLDEQLVFLQRASDPVITDEFCDWLTNTKLINDDELFNAALVGFGSFGLVHGLLIQTEPLYLLEKFVKKMQFTPKVKHAICTMDVEGLGLPKGNELPFHFEVVLNPYYLKKGEEGAFIRVLYKSKLPTTDFSVQQYQEAAEQSTDLFDASYGINPESFIIKKVLAKAIQVVLEEEVKPTDGKLIPGLPGQQFGSDNPPEPTSPAPLPGTSIEISVPLDRVGDAMDLILKITKKHPFGAPLAFRYVKNSRASLAFTQYGPISVAMEMPGLDDPLNFASKGHQAIFDALAESDIPHAYHWGQALPQNNQWVDQSYDTKRLNNWKASRLKLLGEQGCKMFSNKLTEKIGLWDHRQMKRDTSPSVRHSGAA